MAWDGAVLVEREVRELIRRRGLDPVRDPDGVRALVSAAIADYDERSVLGAVPPLDDAAAVHKQVVDAVAGLGPLQRYLDDESVEEVWINSPTQVFVARGGVAELTTTILTDAQVRDLVEQMLKASGRRLDLSSPFVDASLPGGERLHVVIPDVTTRWAVNIRKHVVRASSLDDLVVLGSLPPQAAAFLAAAVEAVAPAMEVVDDRDCEYATLDVLSLVADNSWNAGIVVGEFRRSWPDLAVAAGVAYLDGEEVGRGQGGDVLGHPFRSVGWLAEHLAEEGPGLRAGDIVMTGSIVTTKFPSRASEFRFDVEGLGSTTVRVEP